MNNESNKCGNCGTTCSQCGRPWAICKQDGGCKCNKCGDVKFCEYGRMANGCIREKQPGCPMQAVIPSVTIESIEGIKNLADCFVHVSGINTTFYIDDKHRPIITWAGPVDIPGYDMEGNPNNYRDQIVTDVANQMAVIYDKSGKGYLFGLAENIDLQEQVDNKLDEMVEDGTLEEIINQFIQFNAPLTFNTKADMIASDMVINGTTVELLGVYEKGDIIPRIYKVRTATNDDVNKGIYAIKFNGLIAESFNSNVLNPKLGVNLWLDTNSEERAKDRINTYVTMGVTKIILPLHLSGADCTLTEDIDFVKSMIDYAISQGLTVDTIKFHCTVSSIDSDSSYQTLYRASVLSVLNALSSYDGITRVTVLNERPAFYSRSASSGNVNYAIALLSDIKALGYEVSITISQINRVIEMINYNPTLASVMDFYAANDYPPCGCNGKATSKEDAVASFNYYNEAIKTIKLLSPNKEFYWSEVGIQDNYANYINPADWTFQNTEPSADGNTIPVYFEGLVNLGSINNVDEVWLWYTEYFIDVKNKLNVFKKQDWRA